MTGVTDVGVVDQFLDVFSRYIDSGFGLVRGQVASLAQILVALDVALAALFWAWGPGEEVLARFVRKILYVGTFAFLISNFQSLTQAVYDSFAGLGVTAGGGGLSAGDLMHPSRIAAAGIEAVRPLLSAVGDLAGFPGVFENIVQVAVLLASVLVVLAAFFVLAVQLFVVVLEFKLTTLAGFVLVPFGLFGKTAFLAERVLGNVMASGVKVLVLAVIVSIGSTLFGGFVADFSGAQPSLDQALAIALAALSLLGLGIFGPGVAAGLVAGAPHLGAGAAASTGLAVGGAVMAGAGALRAAGSVAAAAGGGLRSAGAAAASRVRLRGGGGEGGPGDGAPPPGEPPASTGSAAAPVGSEVTAEAAPASNIAQVPGWAKRLRGSLARGLATAARAVKAGDHPPGSAAVPLKEDQP